MFIAQNAKGMRLNSLLLEEDTLRLQARNGEVLCPDCHQVLRFRSGSFKPHFYHQKNNCTNPYSEPESETHINGKTIIYEWLKSLYPSSQVELEYKVDETNQRSDVMVLHPNGEKWAFEFQCSPISEEIWKERHNLYQEAGVLDIWVLNSGINKYLIEADDEKVKISRDLESAIYNEENHAYYLDVIHQLVTIFRGGYFKSKRVLYDVDQFISKHLNDIVIKGNELWSQELLNYFADEDLINRLEDNDVLYNLAEERLMELQREKLAMDRKKQNQFYKDLVQRRNNEYSKLTTTEKRILNKLLQKHQYTLKTMPGLFFYGNIRDLETPLFLIQLWLYDELIYNKSNYKYKTSFPTLWAPNCLKSLYKLEKQRGIRLSSNPQPKLKETYIHIRDNVLQLWEVNHILERLGGFYYRIHNDYLPPHDNLKESIFVEWNSVHRNLMTPDEVSSVWGAYVRKGLDRKIESYKRRR